jgi:predicted alpha-1,2-mannosidase
MKFTSLLLLLVPAVIYAAVGNINYINPMIGTDNVFSGNGNYAGMIPTTGTPFAMTRFTPVTKENSVGSCPYIYTDTTIGGFMATHQPAQWMGESGEMSVAVGTGSVKTAFADRMLPFSHDTEVSSPQYYKVQLNTETGKITAELTSKSRAGALRFSFDDSSVPFAVVQATRAKINGHVSIDAANREIVGWNPERQDDVLGPFTAADFKGYFVARFDQDFASFGTSNNSTLSEGALTGDGEELAAYVRFAEGTKQVNMRVGVSYISIEQARVNLDTEIPDGVSLEDTAAAVADKWSEKVDLVKITNATEDQLAIFYTAMYHALQYPSEMMESNATGTYYYSGYDNQVHAGESAYTGYSIWDTFRAEWAFLNLFAPERINGMITSMLQSYKEGGENGRLPIWLNIVETNIMIGTHSSSLIAESLSKGFTGFDLDLAWEALWKDAMVPPQDDLTTVYYDRERGTSCEARAGLTREKRLGYVAAIKTSEAGSRTLEYAYVILHSF